MACRPSSPPRADADLRGRDRGWADPEGELSEFEQRRRIQLAMEQLPPEQREVLQLRLDQELSLEEIGQITGVGRKP